MMPLGLLSPGERGEIIAIRFHQPQNPCEECCTERKKTGCRLEDLGLRVGKSVEMLSNSSPILVKIDESRIAVDRGMAMKIMVRR